jgi:hypothetical protein
MCGRLLVQGDAMSTLESIAIGACLHAIAMVCVHDKLSHRSVLFGFGRCYLAWSWKY